MSALEHVIRVYQGSDGDATKALYASLEALGPAGFVATNLFRAAKNSERAKLYRGRGYRGAAYDRKGWAIANLCTALETNAAAIGVVWGWGVDEKREAHRHVLYVEIPTGQVSFHAGERGAGPDYAKPWDGAKGQGPDRVIRWCARLLAGAAPEQEKAA